VHVVLTPKDTATGRKLEVSALDTEPPPRRAEGGAADTEA
jgi:hypothetical protein